MRSFVRVNYQQTNMTFAITVIQKKLRNELTLTFLLKLKFMFQIQIQTTRSHTISFSCSLFSHIFFFLQKGFERSCFLLVSPAHSFNSNPVNIRPRFDDDIGI